MSDEPDVTGQSGGIPRRSLLAAATVGGTASISSRAVAAPLEAKPQVDQFHAAHQPGIVSPPLPFLALAAFTLMTPHRSDLGRLLRDWSAAGANLSSADRTVTVGFGPSLFDLPVGLAPSRPAALQRLPGFPGEAIDAATSNGDLCVQVCASTPKAAADGVRALVNAGRPLALLRWRQFGYRPQDGTSDPRGPLGFRDGTSNLDVHDPDQTARNLWVNDGPQWLHGGSYLVVRRIRLLLDTWDRTRVADQEALVGRTRTANRLLGHRSGDGHAQLAAPERNDGATMLRRSYIYDAGVDGNGLQDSGLIFMAFVRDPGKQFVPVQQRLAVNDGLNAFSQHVASALFACPPGCAEGSWLGAELLAESDKIG